MITSRLALTAVLLSSSALCAELKPKPEVKPDPKISSLYPFGFQRGTTVDVVIRGSDLAGARAVAFEGGGIEGRVLGVDTEQLLPGENARKQVVRVQLTVAPEASIGKHYLRAVTAQGISNKITLQVLAEPVLEETGISGPLRRFPVVINGRIARPGESDCYWVEVAAGSSLTFEASSGSAGFDPSLALYEPSGSWFDPQRLNRVAFNDEPLYFPGLSTDARLVQRFARSGRYCLKIQGFSGQGAADFVYDLRISPGIRPLQPLHPPLKETWEERQFTRRLLNSRLEELARRGGLPAKSMQTEIFRAAPEGTAQVPFMTAPGVVEGRIARPGEAHLIRLKIDKAQDLAFEIETPEATLPRFNPVVRIMEPGGREIATDVYTKLNNNGLYMMKMIRAKTTVSFSAPGDYTLQIRDITTNYAGPDFVYRVLVRPQIPHLGNVEVAEDHINLEAGTSHPVTVLVDREEGFSGYVTVGVEGLPAGVTAVTAIENPADKPPLPNGGKLERYTAREQRTALMLVAAPDAAPAEMPVRVRIVVRVVSEQRLLEPVAVKEIPLMVVAGRKS